MPSSARLRPGGGVGPVFSSARGAAGAALAARDQWPPPDRPVPSGLSPSGLGPASFLPSFASSFLPSPSFLPLFPSSPLPPSEPPRPSRPALTALDPANIAPTAANEYGSASPWKPLPHEWPPPSIRRQVCSMPFFSSTLCSSSLVSPRRSRSLVPASK